MILVPLSHMISRVSFSKWTHIQRTNLLCIHQYSFITSRITIYMQYLSFALPTITLYLTIFFTVTQCTHTIFCSSIVFSHNAHNFSCGVSSYAEYSLSGVLKAAVVYKKSKLGGSYALSNNLQRKAILGRGQNKIYCLIVGQNVSCSKTFIV